MNNITERSVYQLHFNLVSSNPICNIEFRENETNTVRIEILISLNINESNLFSVNSFLASLNQSQTFGNWEHADKDKPLKFSMEYNRPCFDNQIDVYLFEKIQEGLVYVDFWMPEVTLVAVGLNQKYENLA